MSASQFSDDLTKSTIAYYNAHADEFVAGTVGLDMKAYYDPFLDMLASGASILDAGCGSGRDSLYFLRQGYQVTAFDASQEMVRRASDLTGIAVRQLAFEDMEFAESFDGVWACASLLHVQRAQIDDVIRRLTRALRRSGVLYVSFKYGGDETLRGQRLFTNYTERSFGDLLLEHPDLEMVQLWVSMDVRPNRADERWLNAILRKR